MFKLDLEKAEEPEIKLPTSTGSSKKQESSRKISTSALLAMPNLPPYLPPENCMQVKKQQLKLDVEQQSGSKTGKKYIKTVYCHPAYLTYMQSTS